MSPPLDPLETLQRKIETAQAERAEKERDDDPSPQENLGTAMRLGVELVAGVGVGSVFGFFVDKWLGTMPLFFILCFFLGAAAGFRNMLRR